VEGVPVVDGCHVIDEGITPRCLAWPLLRARSNDDRRARPPSPLTPPLTPSPHPTPPHHLHPNTRWSRRGRPSTPSWPTRR
jgi:hypothetical protein